MWECVVGWFNLNNNKFLQLTSFYPHSPKKYQSKLPSWFREKSHSSSNNSLLIYLKVMCKSPCICLYWFIFP